MTTTHADAEGASGFAAVPDYTMSLEEYPHRMRAIFNDTVIADSTRVIVLHEIRHAPYHYFPREDVRMDLLRRTDHQTHCPFKGNASYWTLTVGERTAENVAWSYEDPYAEIAALAGYISFYWDKLDAWLEDDEATFERLETAESMEINPLVDWIMREAWESTTSRELVGRLARRLVELGVPLMRMTVMIRTLHPLLAATGYRWARKSGDVERFEAPHAMYENRIYLESPLRPIFEGAGGVRRWISASGGEVDFPILEDLRREGATDYVAMPMIFSDGQINAITLAADGPGGFSTRDLGHIYEILPVLSHFFEVHAKRRSAATLMETFIGQHTGERVLDGLVKRGDGETIHAVIWLSDLRDSTEIAETLSRERFLGYLNRFFDCTAGAVIANEGEVLRFIGDAVLAIFPVGNDGRPGRTMTVAEACERAIATTSEARKRVTDANADRETGGYPALRYGIGLHLGDVMYGNIGVPERLEFTVIGAAANEAFRIEAMTKVLEQTVVASQAFADEYSGRLLPLGRHRLRGVAGEQTLFTVPHGLA